MAKPLTLLESLLVQILIYSMNQPKKDGQIEDPYPTIVALLRAGLTKQQANKALGR